MPWWNVRTEIAAATKPRNARIGADCMATLPVRHSRHALPLCRASIAAPDAGAGSSVPCGAGRAGAAHPSARSRSAAAAAWRRSATAACRPPPPAAGPPGGCWRCSCARHRCGRAAAARSGRCPGCRRRSGPGARRSAPRPPAAPSAPPMSSPSATRPCSATTTGATAIRLRRAAPAPTRCQQCDGVALPTAVAESPSHTTKAKAPGSGGAGAARSAARSRRPRSGRSR